MIEHRLLLAAIAAWIVVAVLSIASGPPLGHDEAAFSVLARGGGAASWMYRSSGVVALAHVGVWLGGAEWAVRLAPLVVGVGIVLATWAVGRHAFGARTGAWAAAVIAGAHPLALRSAEMIGDVPATACLLAGVAVLVRELDDPQRGAPRWQLMAVAPAFAGAFYLRYGSAPVIALVALCALVAWWRAILRRPGPVLATCAAFAALLLPHAVHSLHETGKVLGVLEFSSHVPRRAYIGEGLVEYLTSDPFALYGALATPLLLAGLVALVRPDPARRRATWFLGAIALGQLVVIGLESHAEPRYVYFATALLVVLGVDVIRRLAPPRPRLALLVVGLAWLGCAIAIVPYNIHLRRLRTPLLAAASAIRADAAGRPCLVVARVTTQLEWYTGCSSRLLRDPAAIGTLPPGQLGYVASVPLGVTPIEPVAAGLHATATPIATGDPQAHVWLVR